MALTVYMSSYYYICVLMLLYRYAGTNIVAFGPRIAEELL